MQVSLCVCGFPSRVLFLFRRIHQFESFAHFQTSLIVDAFVMSLVSEHRRKTSPLLAFTLEQILERSPTPLLIAKCAECTIKKELGNANIIQTIKIHFIVVVCPECEQVICLECISQHQLVVNNHVQENFNKCKDTWNMLCEKSMLFDEQQFDLESYLYELKYRIEKRSNFLLELIEKWRMIYHNRINQYSEIFNNIHHEITTEFQSLNQQIEIFVKFVNSNL
jgi:hypothetical protein